VFTRNRPLSRVSAELFLEATAELSLLGAINKRFSVVMEILSTVDKVLGMDYCLCMFNRRGIKNVVKQQ